MKKRSFSAILLVVFSLFIATSLFSQSGDANSSDQNSSTTIEGIGGGMATGEVNGVFVPD